VTGSLVLALPGFGFLAVVWVVLPLIAQFDPATAMLLARLRVMQFKPEAAWAMVVAAERAGAAQSVCAPLLAEAAYLMKKFDAIPRLLARLADDPTNRESN
jgi:hypothetical protein